MTGLIGPVSVVMLIKKLQYHSLGQRSIISSASWKLFYMKIFELSTIMCPILWRRIVNKDELH
jgi:hypothetical protein